MVVYGSITNVSIGALFAAGFLPAFVMAIALAVQQMISARRAGLEPEPRSGWGQRARAFYSALWALMMPVIIFGGILGGVFTPTEAAVVAAVYAMLAGGLIYREITPAFLYRALVRTGLVTGVVMLMIAGANILSWLMTVERVPHAMARLIQDFGGGQSVFILLSVAAFLVLFALLDGLPGMLMITPVFVPLAQQLGVDLLHYGIIMTAVMGIALFLPPFGVGLFIVLGISGCSLREMSRELFPYIVTMLVVALVIAYVPAISFAVPAALGLYRVPGT
jgi:C4-dicarboxylate transporter DctM subunit